jgi:hypothetical protein
MCPGERWVTLLDMTAPVRTPPAMPCHAPDRRSDGPWVELAAEAASDHFVPLPDTPETAAFAYSETVDNWYWVPAENVAPVEDRRRVPADVFLLVHALLLIETLLALIGQQGQAWRPVGVVIIALLAVALSANFIAGVAAARAGRASSTIDPAERGRWFIAGFPPH